MAITESRSLPPQFVEDLGKDYATQLTGLTSQALDTKKFQPMVAGQDQAQTDAYNLATTQGQGIGSYAPYLSQAGAYQTGTGTFAGQPTNMMGSQDYLQQQGTMSGPNAYQQFMSPYQQDVIDASLAKFDQQAAAGITGIGQTAAMSGNLGGGREGVMRAQYQSDSDMNRALLQAGMLQSGFGQAQTQANTAFGQQTNLGQQIQQQQTADVNQLGLLGGLQQAQTQAGLTATQEGNRLRAMEPYERMGQYGSGVMGLISGMGNQYQSQVTPNPTPLQTALGTASVLGGIFNPRKD